MPNKKVLITGASGLIGGLVLDGLSDKYEFSGLSRRPVGGIPHTAASITDAEAIKPAFEGIDTVLHLAAGTGGTTDSWELQMSLTAQGTLNVFRAAQEAGAKRVVFMSAGSTMMGWQRDESKPYGAMWRGDYADVPETWEYVDYTWEPRPLEPYSVCKLFGENLCRLWADLYGMSMLAMRCGALLPSDHPEARGHYPGFLSHADAVQMVDRLLSAPDDMKFGIFDAISENDFRWRSTDPAKELRGYAPTGRAEDWKLGDGKDVDG